ncbi:MAG: MBL fold metallo-hydrolase [Desulfobulbaceae bacterium]|nr:MBL fold metallo-hydrolase [Desulfobulbaceae bacterium]
MRIEQIPVGMMQVCCYIVSCEETNEAAIIDPGGDEDKILQRCRANNLQVKYLIATHGHPDHVCGNSRLKEETGAQIVMHKDDAVFFQQPEVRNYFSMLGLPESPPPDMLVEDGDTITFGREQLQVIHTPGHTPGGMCLYNPPDCFTGDTLFAAGVGRTDFPGGSSRELMDSIRTRLFVLPPETIVWPGHGYGGSKSTIGEEARSNPFLN